MNSNSLVIKEKQKQTIKRKYEDWSSKPNCKIEFFVPYNGHQNCLDKSLIEYRKCIELVLGLEKLVLFSKTSGRIY